MKATDLEKIASKVKMELNVIFSKSHSLRAYYLISRGNNYVWPPFSSEDLAQFVIWLLINNFRGLTDIPPLPEIIVKYLIGDVEGGTNAIASAVKASFFDGKIISTQVSWDEYYYLDFLPSQRLFHLTSSYEKSHAAKLCTDRLLKQATSICDLAMKIGNPSSQSPAISFQSQQAISLFASMQHGAVLKNRPFSVTVCGLHKSMIGLGEDSRRLFDMLTQLGFRVELFDCSPPSLERDPTADFYEIFETKVPCSEVVIFCMPVFEMARILPKLTANFFAERYVIGYWPWELSAFPIGWREIMDLVDEVWASSHFLKRVYGSECSKPVYYVPLCVEIGDDICYELAASLIQPDTACFLNIFDFNSSVTRKNPVGSIKAFKLAFPDDQDNARLVLKTIHGGINAQEMKYIIDEIDDDDRIILFDGPTSRANLNGLIDSSFALLSLHRSEGFGRLPVEAMLLGTPVIATDWSGSCDFINEETAFPVAYQLKNVDSSEYPYAAGVWADPDLDDAARIMRSIIDEEALTTRVAKTASFFARSNFSSNAVMDILSKKLISIENHLRSNDRNRSA